MGPAALWPSGSSISRSVIQEAPGSLDSAWTRRRELSDRGARSALRFCAAQGRNRRAKGRHRVV